MSFLSRLFPPSFETQLARKLAARPEVAVEIVADGLHCWAISDGLMAVLAAERGVRPTRARV